MFTYKFFFLSILLFSFHTSFSQSNKIDVAQYRIELNVNDTTNCIVGKTTIRFKALQATNTISLDLVTYDAATKKGMQVIYIVDGNDTLAYQAEAEKIIVQFNNNLAAGTEKTLTLAYTGVPEDGLIISKNKFGHRTIFADNWPNRAHYWFPCNDTPADKAAVEFLVTAPEHYQVISNGLLKEEKNLSKQQKLTHFAETVELPTKVMVVGLADFAVEHSGDVDSIPVYSYVYPEDKEKAFYDYAIAKDILAWFIKNVGPYGYKKLANVQSTTRFGGMENASAIFYSEDAISGARKNESLLAHEIAHQWFGNMVTEKSFDHVWLSEGFATYFTDLYLEAKYGEQKLQDRLRAARDKAIRFSKKTNAPVINSTTEYTSLLNAFSYEKGSWVLHMLRRKVGDEFFWKAIRTYYTTYSGKNANTDDLRDVFEKVCNTNLKSFFQQWLFVKEHPVLDVTWKYNAAKKKITISIRQKQTTLFQFPLQIKLDNAIKEIEIKNAVTTVTFPCKTKLITIALDPNVNLFFEGTMKEIKE